MTNNNKALERAAGEDALFDDEFGLDFVEIGKPVPDLEFKVFHNNDVKNMRISDFRGKWLVLFFYPGDFTFVCPTELEELAENYEKFQELNTEVVSVSCDSVFVHKAWHDTSEAVKQVKYPMAADPTAKLAKTFDVYIYEDGEALRGTFIIDPEGVLKSIEVNHNDIGRSATELLRKLQAAQYVMAHGGNVCPASWKPGDDTLQPGLDLVGKI